MAFPRPPKFYRPRRPNRPSRPQNYIQMPDNLTPRESLPKDREEMRQERWKAFSQRTHASYIEFICYEWLIHNKGMKPGIDFVHKARLHGARRIFEGAEADFYFESKQMVWMVQGLRFHRVKAEHRMQDRIAKTLLTNMGFKVVELFEDDIINRTNYTLERALKGMQVSRPFL